MWSYVIRKLLLMIPTIFGIIVFTFLLFNVVNKDPARAYAGKMKSEAQVDAIRVKMRLDKPHWINRKEAKERGLRGLFNSQFFDVLTFRLAPSYRYQESVWVMMARKAPVSLAIQLPAFIIELGLQLAIALYVAARRGKPVDYLVTFLSVLGLSIPPLSIYLAAQWLFGSELQWFPVAGWDRGFFFAIHFAALPILVSVFASLGGGTRFYRTIVLEEIGADYVRTAKAKGLAGSEILLTHVLRNVMVPVITNTIIVLPMLITGALLLERLFQIPGMGAMLVDSIATQDQPALVAVVYVTSIGYCLALVLTDVLYAWADPRVSLK